MSFFNSVKNLLDRLRKKPMAQQDVPENKLENFLDQTLDNVMIQRSDIVAIPTHTPCDEVVRKFLKTGFLWFPVFRDTLDTVVGLVSVHCILSLRESSDTSEHQWCRHLNAPTFCPSSMTVREALRTLQDHHKIPMLFVVDEYGGVQGIVTKDHLLRDLFDSYIDDFSDEEEMILGRDPIWVINGRMNLEDFAEEFNAHALLIPEDDGRVHTLGGWICAYVGRVPLTGEIIAHPAGWTFEIRQATPRQVHQIAIVQAPIDSAFDTNHQKGYPKKESEK
jgi:magnesium and cobalt transporter